MGSKSRRRSRGLNANLSQLTAADERIAKPPLKDLLCADQNLSQRYSCQNPGVLSCSGCLLVRYCSKGCQNRHWPSHKQDCKNRMNSSSWKPGWEAEGRTPAFVGNGPAMSSHGLNMPLWGNMPAIDIVNGSKGPESLRNRNLSLAFIASGDLRNVIKSVNSLPEDYTGELNILLNDHSPLTVARNFLILSILGLVNDIELTSESALHLWYSSFLPTDFLGRAFLPITGHGIMTQNFDGAEIQLTSKTTMSTTLNRETVETIHSSMILSAVSSATANNALNEVMNAPERVDYRDRFYYGLKPAHRVAFQEFRRSGIVMPFGAYNAHLSVPNPTLITSDGKFCLNDSASPLQGWDIPEVLKAGVSHRTTEQDIMGCLYFYVKDQLEIFAKRLRQFNIKIRMYDQDALKLPAALPRKLQQYNRIEVSNIVDVTYCGVEKVLETWGPCLNSAQTDSALIGLFMNWAYLTPNATVQWSSSSNAVTECIRKMPRWAFGLDPHEFRTLTMNSPAYLRIVSGLGIVFENSEIFLQYLKDNKADVASLNAGIKMREINEIVPHRFGARLGSNRDALPDFKSSEELYIIRMTGATFSERYVEWTIAGSGSVERAVASSGSVEHTVAGSGSASARGLPEQMGLLGFLSSIFKYIY